MALGPHQIEMPPGTKSGQPEILLLGKVNIFVWVATKIMGENRVLQYSAVNCTGFWGGDPVLL